MAKEQKNKDDKMVTITISESLANQIGLTQESAINIIVLDDMIIVKPEYKQSDDDKRAITQSLIDQYEPVLKKLAKT